MCIVGRPLSVSGSAVEDVSKTETKGMDFLIFLGRVAMPPEISVHKLRRTV
jgi:hypothetical protein